ncbi:MAG TPA: sigma-54 dependent transcriptional regulator [Blastocatellia bacterium]|nr:sigma-54 dependent transcriptional regulator [Blastocatellia bacterium]
MNADTVLLLDFDPAGDLGLRVQEILEPPFGHGIHVQREPVAAFDAGLRDAEVRRLMLRAAPSLIILVLPDGDPESAASLFESLTVPVIVVIGSAEPREMLKLLELGATDFISPPLSPLNLLPRMWRLLDRARRGEDLKNSLKQKLGLKLLVGDNPSFVAEVNRIPVVAKCDATVLILGETGTGKELFARAIHYLSPRAAKPFVPVNCGAIPVDLVENELFGHERGAYTGASTSAAGLISEADGGTLFLDEIDCLPPMAQVKLLRFIQEKEYRPLGSSRIQRADLRIVAASNTDLRQAVQSGRMRQDLYYRLNILPFMLPPLRDRREDIPLLTRRFIVKYAAEFGKQLTGLAPGAIRVLMAHDWPGNVRELEHVIERAAVLSEGPVVLETDISVQTLEPDAERDSFQEAKAKVIERFEKTYIKGLLLAHGGNITRAAQAAHKNRRAFFELMRKHNIEGRTFKATPE